MFAEVKASAALASVFGDVVARLRRASALTRHLSPHSHEQRHTHHTRHSQSRATEGAPSLLQRLRRLTAKGRCQGSRRGPATRPATTFACQLICRGLERSNGWPRLRRRRRRLRYVQRLADVRAVKGTSPIPQLMPPRLNPHRFRSRLWLWNRLRLRGRAYWRWRPRRRCVPDLTGVRWAGPRLLHTLCAGALGTCPAPTSCFFECLH